MTGAAVVDWPCTFTLADAMNLISDTGRSSYSLLFLFDRLQQKIVLPSDIWAYSGFSDRSIAGQPMWNGLPKY